MNGVGLPRSSGYSAGELLAFKRLEDHLRDTALGGRD